MLDAFSNVAAVVRPGQQIRAHESPNPCSDDTVAFREQYSANLRCQPSSSGAKGGSNEWHNGRPNGRSNCRTYGASDRLSDLFRERCRAFFSELSQCRFNALLNF